MDLCRLYGYEAEEHVLQTKDGYLLGLHRLAWKKGEEGQKVNSGPGSLKKKVLYLHHGLLMNSEVWVCLTDERRCLPFVLAEQGYDVWVGSRPPYNRLSAALTSIQAWQQPWQQVFKEVGTPLAQVARVLEFLHRRVCFPRHPRQHCLHPGDDGAGELVVHWILSGDCAGLRYPCHSPKAQSASQRLHRLGTGHVSRRSF